MAVTYEEALDYIRKGSLMLDEALSRNDSQSRAKIRVAFYQLYQAANGKNSRPEASMTPSFLLFHDHSL